MTFQLRRNSANENVRLLCALLLSVPLLFASACGGGGSGNGGGSNPPPQSPTITSVSVTCPSLTVPTGQSSQCSAAVSGTGSYSSGVTWTVNSTSGGSATYGTISAVGLYQAPVTAPSAYVVTVSATSTADSTKSGSFSVLIAGTIATATQPIVASTGGTISLPGGDSVTIPAGTLTANTTASLQLSSVATQPTNTLFGGIGPSLLMSFSPAVGGVGAAASRHAFRPSAAPSASASSSTSNITFTLQGGQGLSTTQLQNAFGVLNVNDGTNNFFSLPSSYDATSNATTLTVDPSMIEPSSTLEIGIAVAVANGQNSGGNPSLQEWDDSIPAFTNTPASYCPTGSRVLVLIHGIFSDVQDSFGNTGGAAGCALKNGTSSCPVARGPYDTVLGINYDWSKPIASSSIDVANILNSFFAGSCSFSGTIDIEAHSEGTLVTLTSADNLSSSAKAKLAHIALVAGPIDGTPLASDADAFITVFMNEALESASTVIDPSITQNQKAQLPIIISELAPATSAGSAVPAAQSAAAKNLSQTEIVAIGGDKSFLPWWGSWIETLPAFSGAPNDGVVPVASALPTDSSLPNLVRLVGNDPTTGDYPYPDNHVSLVNNQNVMPAILSALNGGGETAQVSLNITPPSATLAPGQAITLTANVANMLNPQLLWSVSGGAANGTLNQSTGTTVQYTAPLSSGGPYEVSAAIQSLPVSFAPATMTVTASSDNPVPAINQLNPASLAAGAVPQALTINGTGFLNSSTVTFNGIFHAATFVNASQLTISLTSADLATVGAYPVVVTNPAPGGGPSSPANFTVTSAANTGFTATGNMTTPRSYHTATVLNNGKVLIAGGTTVNGGSCTCSIAELYDPITRVFTQTGSMTVGREQHTATLLNNGKVLLAGGVGLSSAELYDPATGTFAATGSMTTARYQHIATLLTNGKVLITGGISGTNYVASAELYDPVTGTFSATGSMTAARALFSATLLNNGMVLVAGGEINGTAFLSSAELYDPATGEFTATGALGDGRFYHTATLLNSGKVLIAGGYNVAYLSNAELYDPTSGTFSPTGSLNISRSGHTAALLNNGQVLVAGGYDSSYGYLGRPELYDPASGIFSSAGSMVDARVYHTETLLTNGSILIAGGYGGSGGLSNLASAELYQPSTLTPPELVSIAVTSSPLVQSPQWTTQQFTATGTFTDGSTQVLQSVTWSSSNTSVATISNDATDRGVAVDVAPGTAVITASDGTVSGTGTFVVTGLSVNITPTTATLAPGGTQQFTATVSGSGGVNWSIKEGSSGGTIVSTGLSEVPPGGSSSTSYTANYFAPNTSGIYHVVATSTVDSSQSATATVSVTASASSISISPSSVTVPAGAVQTFAAIVPGGGSATWSVQEGAAGGSVTFAGIYTAPAATGTYHVLATNSANSAQTATATVNVIAATAYSVLYSFPYAFESASLIQATDGHFYGTNEMFAYKIDSSGNLTQLGSLSSSPDAPISSLIQATDGNFYGVDSEGNGSIFKMDSSGNVTTMYSFPNANSGSTSGLWPWAGLIQGTDGNFYGTTYAGGNISCTPNSYGVPAYGPFNYNPGAGYGCGTVFKMDSSGNITVLYSFSGQSDGNFPQAPLIQGSDGYFYGTTSAGGANGYGTIFKMDALGNLQVLHSLSYTDGGGPVAALLQAADGNLYGTTTAIPNSSTSGGEVFKVGTAGSNFTVLHSFSGVDGWSPVAPLIQGSDGSFYGTTWAGGDLTCGSWYYNVGSNYPYVRAGGCGTVFKMDSAGNVTVLHTFEEPQTGDGNDPYAGLLLGKDGYLYGTTYYGGTSIYFGTVFRLNAPSM